ncbi:MAG: acetyltransferase [Firmicutes bacterium]|nr:acetyltransferase [Bacillota bacterium]
MITILGKVYRFFMTIVLLKIKGVKFGKRPSFGFLLPIIGNQGKIEVGNKFRIRGLQFRTQFGTGKDGELLIGNNVFFNQGVNIYAEKKIVIEDDVSLGDLVTIYDTNFHEVGEGEGIKVSPVFIGRNVWIGRNAIILPGAHIGENSVIGAGSIVSSMIPPNSLVVGNPGRVVRTLKCSASYVRIV